MLLASRIVRPLGRGKVAVGIRLERPKGQVGVRYLLLIYYYYYFTVFSIVFCFLQVDCGEQNGEAKRVGNLCTVRQSPFMWAQTTTNLWRFSRSKLHGIKPIGTPQSAGTLHIFALRQSISAALAFLCA